MISCNWGEMNKVYGPDKTTSDIFPEYTIKANQFDEQISSHFDEWLAIF